MAGQSRMMRTIAEKFCSGDKSRAPASKTNTFQFKLINISTRSNPLSIIELEQITRTRGRKKPCIIATLCDSHIQLKYKHESKEILSSTLENVRSVLQLSSAPRALAFSVLKPGVENSYISVALIAKKNRWFRRKKIVKFADILAKKVISLQKLPQKSPQNSEVCTPINTTTPISLNDINMQVYEEHQHHLLTDNANDEISQDQINSILRSISTSYPENSSKVSNQPFAWSVDIFAAERCKMQQNYNILQGTSLLATGSSCDSSQSDTTTLQQQQHTRDNTDQQQRKNCLQGLSAALESSFVSSCCYANTSPFCDHRPWVQQGYQFSDSLFQQESGLLQYMNMLVPLESTEAATCSRTDTFQYIPLHVWDPSLDRIPLTHDYELPSPKLRNLNDNSIPEHVRKGICYDESDFINFKPEYEITLEDCSDRNWFSGKMDTAVVVGSTWNNGLQQFPTYPNHHFIHRMEKLFNAYLNPKMYHERNLGISNNPEKLAKYLASTDYPGMDQLNILSYRDPNLSKCLYFRPCCARDPDLDLVLD